MDGIYPALLVLTGIKKGRPFDPPSPEIIIYL
jgi:hypothetical protein